MPVAPTIQLVYEPIVDLRSEIPVGYEVLARFEHADTLTEIAAMERNNGITEFDCTMIGLAAAATRRTPLFVHVNCSALTAQQSPDKVIDVVLRHVAQRSAVAHRLVIEITETAPVFDIGAIEYLGESMHRLGVRFCADDIETGSLLVKHLDQAPWDIAKIPREIVIGDVTRTAVLIGEIKRRGMISVVEGLASRDDIPLMRTLGADLVQSHAVSRPVSEL